MTESAAPEVNPYKFPFPEGPDRFPFPDGPMSSPPPEFARRRRECPVSEVTLPMGDKVLLAVKHGDIQSIMSDDRRFVRDLSEPNTPQLFPNMEVLEDPTMLMNMHGDDHLRLRRIISPAVNPRRIDEWRPEIREIMNEILDEMEAKGSPADLMSEFAGKVPIRLVLRQFGLPDTDGALLRRWVSTWLSVAMPEEMAAVREEFTAWVVATAARSRANPGTALIDRLVNAQDDGDRMSDRELESMIRSMIAGGIESIGNGISRSVFTLLREREHWEHLLANRELVPTAVEELIRVNPPGGGSVGLMRKAAEDVELPSGAVIRKGQWVLTPAVAAGHDPEAFPEPENYRLDRPKLPSTMMFGAGRHFCPGVHLAKAEIEIALDVLLERFPSLHMTVAPEDLPWNNSTFTIGLPCLPVAW
ncbi:cytochrome P450 [Frankia sp. AgB1.9]|uniref:cytochrome P450 n=1 Tax=unclassified Frankia TaxID=2632575 RepID=UPI00193359A2|nr:MULTISPECIES: cytochrome P450 [unclassified Frankia]MBL7492317.1 cytochrome P450 [Frankia sp. AgW1.1]MBL7551866.1 cytochrome P450 [Frankia sp. AgB1.9]MBL7625553.1 cytochrome P450 [Frankia sp. AgB1.8]